MHFHGHVQRSISENVDGCIIRPKGIGKGGLDYLFAVRVWDTPLNLRAPPIKVASGRIVLAVDPGRAGEFPSGFGIANVMGIYNSALTYAISQGIDYLLPAPSGPMLMGSSHHGSSLDRDFAEIFSPPNGKSCSMQEALHENMTLVVATGCSRDMVYRGKLVSKGLSGDVVEKKMKEFTRSYRCWPDEMYWNQSALEHAEGDVAIVFPSRRLRWHFDYGGGRAEVFASAFDNAVKMIPASGALTTSGKISIALHVRMGDVFSIVNKGSAPSFVQEKFLPHHFYTAIVRHLLNVLNENCITINVFTDAKRHHPNEAYQFVSSLVNKLRALRDPPISVLLFDASQLSAVQTLIALTSADLLVASSSGFSRLAAVLRTYRKGATIAFDLKSHPLESRTNMMVIPPSTHNVHGSFNNDQNVSNTSTAVGSTVLTEALPLTLLRNFFLENIGNIIANCNVLRT